MYKPKKDKKASSYRSLLEPKRLQIKHQAPRTVETDPPTLENNINEKEVAECKIRSICEAERPYSGSGMRAVVAHIGRIYGCLLQLEIFTLPASKFSARSSLGLMPTHWNEIGSQALEQGVTKYCLAEVVLRSRATVLSIEGVQRKNFGELKLVTATSASFSLFEFKTSQLLSNFRLWILAQP
ncbi:hypothetical protein T265_03435 [Opisthorchis viverrini]|uniref:Uncharacterized protein n=1 Tax=Opisthorchis viverrini TaxID=6198 RepID=A0A074ZW07_OPIVI|nr:hypothetical protein T265_03435 [Opisthorchis viverrini]KER30067.1 hypothetical protein T265_03435 [Opisthorchis viverrini]